jgi:sugar transferase (PEP-CTERM/EpsH1 system associated)
MRVLFLAHRLPYPPDKGDKIRSFRELEEFASRHELDLFCFYDDPNDRHYLHEVSRYCRDVYAEPVSGFSSRIRALKALCLGRPFTTGFFYSRGMERRVRGAINDRGYDLIFVYGSAVAQYVQGINHPTRVLDLVDVDSDKWRQYACYSKAPISWIWNAEAARLGEYENRIVREFSMTLVSTPAEADLLRRLGVDARIEYLENRFDTTYFDPTKVNVPAEIASCQPYIVFTGSMDYFPNVDAVHVFCREVFPRIRAQVPNAQFFIAGRNPTRLVRKLALLPGVRVTGAVADIRPYLRGASAAVAPLRIARGIQTKIFEAMAMNLPVAVSNKAAMAMPACLRREVHIEDDSRALAGCLIRLLQAKRHESETTRAALVDYVEHTNWRGRWAELISGVVPKNAAEVDTTGRILLAAPKR